MNRRETTILAIEAEGRLAGTRGGWTSSVLQPGSMVMIAGVKTFFIFLFCPVWDTSPGHSVVCIQQGLFLSVKTLQLPSSYTYPEMEFPR